MQRDGQRIAAEEDAAAEAVVGVEEGVDGAEGEDGVEEGLPAGLESFDVDEDVADEQAEPADFDGDGFGGQFPAERDRRGGFMAIRHTVLQARD